MKSIHYMDFFLFLYDSYFVYVKRGTLIKVQNYVPKIRKLGFYNRKSNNIITSIVIGYV